MVKVGLTLQAKQDGNPAAAVAGSINLALYGPGDIIGIDPRLVVRTDPKPNCTNFEPNYLAIIDFDPPDFPWLLTPAHANVNHQLRPWLVLVGGRAQPGRTAQPQARRTVAVDYTDCRTGGDATAESR